jgi:serine/threonine protein kinase
VKVIEKEKWEKDKNKAVIETYHHFLSQELGILFDSYHINIPSVFEMFECEGKLYMVFELLEGGTLEDRLKLAQ